MTREKFPNRRAGWIAHLRRGKTEYQVTFSLFGGLYGDGNELRVGEIFISSSKPGSEAAECARDGALLASHALQNGVTIEQLAHSITRESDGTAATVIGEAIDLVAAEVKALRAELAKTGAGT